MGKQMKLGVILQGVGIDMAGWRHPDMQPDASVSIDWHIRQARLAESAKLDLVFITDGLFINPKVAPHFLNRLEPLTLLSALAVATRHIGLVGTVSTSYSEPFTVARQLASLDMISGGRAGWNVVTSPVEAAARNFNIRDYPAHSLRYRIADEFVQVVQGLWDSWEDDAFVYDKEKDRFFDPDKLHALHHKGEFFAVEGPLNIARSRQGQPVIFQAGASDEGTDFGAQYAEGVFVAPKSMAAAQRFYRELKAKAASRGRLAGELLIMPSLTPIVGRTPEEAERKYREELELLSLERALHFLGRFFDHHDFTGYDPDAPFPDLDGVGSEGFRSTTAEVMADARANGLTLREVAYRVAKPRPEFIGTPAQIADRMQDWLEHGAADGFMLYSHSPSGLSDFVEHVIPILRQRGLFRTEYEQATLRGHLGFAVPVNRCAAARKQT